VADLTLTDMTGDPCCAPEQQATCCEPSAKADCCGHDQGCNCDTTAVATHASDVLDSL
jgi:hypothetical protein